MAETTNQKLSDILQTTQGKTYTVAAITIFLTVLMVFLAIRPALLSITDKLNQNDLKQQYIDSISTKLTTLRQLLTQQDTYKYTIADLNTYIPDKHNDEFMIANITRIATQYNCTLGSISFGKVEAVKDTSFVGLGGGLGVPLSISITGTLSDLQLFIAHLESFPSTITINSLNYTNKVGDSTSTDLTASLPPDTFKMTIEARYYIFNTPQ